MWKCRRAGLGRAGLEHCPGMKSGGALGGPVSGLEVSEVRVGAGNLDGVLSGRVNAGVEGRALAGGGRRPWEFGWVGGVEGWTSPQDWEEAVVILPPGCVVLLGAGQGAGSAGVCLQRNDSLERVL